MWQPRLDDEAALKYLGIVQALAADLAAGRIARGDRLPSQRAIAEALNVDLTTVTRAFNEARRRGLVDAHPGRGTFISTGPAQPWDGQVDLGMNIPSPPAGLDFRRLIPEGLSRLLAGPRAPSILHYQDSAGPRPDRDAAAHWLGARLGHPSAERIVITAGAQNALHTLCGLLLRPGDGLAAARLTYPGLRAVAGQIGLALVPLAVDAQGILPEAFEDACHRQRPRALYLVPAIDNPTTASLPPDRREALATVARRHGVAIIEDDPYSPLLPDPAPALAAGAAADITWHIATLSKCATPALRTAYVVAPDAKGAARLAERQRASLLMPPPLMTALASRWIEDGMLTALAEGIRQENRARQALAAGILGPAARIHADPCGHHLWLQLPDPWRADGFADQAGRAGVAIVPASAFTLDGAAEEAVRVSLGVATDLGVLEDGLLRLATLLAHPPETRSRAIV